VIFNGDGSDELCGGYLYMYKCPDLVEFDKETRRLLRDIYLFDVLRSDKCISSHGLEPRTPFLDKSWVNFYLSLPVEYRFHVSNKVCEKHLLRTSFSLDHFKNSLGKKLLPDSILWRTKEAFSDGVSKHGRSLYEIIDEKVKPELLKMIEKDSIDDMDLFLKGKELKQHLPPDYKKYEQVYYRMIFEQFYGGKGSVLPYFWMPKYVAAGDASARSLDIYSEINKATIDETKDLGNLDKTTHGFNCRCQ
jgi:asparagine synthase (glutamine-hydrolysing)